MREKVRVNFVLCSLSSLLVGAYLDNVRGPLLPVFAQVLNINYGETSLFLVLGSAASIVVTFLLIPALNRWDEKRVTQVICGIALTTAVASLGVKSYAGFLVFAMMVGSSVCSLGAICNVLLISGTDATQRSRFMCALHTVYGVSSIAAPAVAGFLLSRHFPWPWLFLASVPLSLALLLFVTRYIPTATAEKVAPESLRVNPLQMLIILVFALYVAGEVMTSMWMVTYLVEAKKFSILQAAPYLTAFFVVMAATRVFCFFSLSPAMETVVLWASLILFCFFFAFGHLGMTWAFPLCGVLGPWFPLVLSRVSRDFPAQSRAITLWILTMMHVTLGLSHFLVGRFTDTYGVEITYRLPLFLMAAAMAALFAYLRAVRKHPAPSTSGMEPMFVAEM